MAAVVAVSFPPSRSKRNARLALTPGEPFGEGTWLVGIDIEPGRYFASSPSEDCDWYRLDSFGGEHTDGHYTPDGAGWFPIVDIDASDVGFESFGCGTWTKEAPAASAPRATFGDGVWRVGADIAPGRYFTASPPEGCVWYRLDDFGGYEGGYLGISRNYIWYQLIRLAVADIAASDVGFVSLGCGTWTAEPPAPRATLGEVPVDGVLLMGHEVAPGRYRATARYQDPCIWRRLGSFGGTRDDLIGYTWRAKSISIVDIEPSDAGFYSEDCGWKADWPPAAVPGEPFRDGTYIVGTEVAPGRYLADRFRETCDWQRLSKFGGSAGSDSGVLASRWAEERAIMEIAPSDVGFVSWGCGRWRPVLDRSHPPVTWIDPGMYVVGVEVEPGTYRGSGTGRCQWERLSGFGGTDGETIGCGGRGDSSHIVEIAPTDAGFWARKGCGRWVRDGGSAITPGTPFAGGTWRVGEEIAPGRYRAPSLGGPGGSCWWARLGGFRGTDEEYLGRYEAGWNTHSSAIIDITASDAGFVSEECGIWTRIADPVLAPGEPILDGAFLVGDEIDPGRYRQVTPTDRKGRPCEWERVSGFGGSEAEVIASGSAPAGEEATVEIAASDTGFISYACGPWTKAP